MKKNVDPENGFVYKDISDWKITPCDVIFNHVEKPKDYLFCRSINTYDDRWRVNIYSKREVHGIESKYISKSHAVVFNNKTGDLTLLS